MAPSLHRNSGEVLMKTKLSPAHYADPEIPLGGYLTLMATYSATFAGLTFLTRKTETRLPVGDLALLAIASYKLSRIVTMSFIGSPLRAPFAERGEDRKGGEVQDVARGRGLQKAVGNLVTCPFCFNVWSATLFRFSFARFPRATRNAAQILTLAAIGDVLHHGYRTLRENAD